MRTEALSIRRQRRRRTVLHFAATLLVGALVIGGLRAQDPICRNGTNTEITDAFHLSASQVSGAVGDVVGIDIVLTLERPQPERLAAVWVNACYDPTVLELLTPARVPESMEDASFLSYFYPIAHGENGITSTTEQSAVVLGFDFIAARALELFDAPGEHVLATVYFRVISGAPGDRASLRFRDDEVTLPGGACSTSHLYWSGGPIQLSSVHEDGEVYVLDGEPQHPEPPELEPLARVYPDVPTAENTELHYELGGAVGQPGGRVSLPLWVESSRDFTGYSVGLVFPPDAIRVVSVEEHTRRGVVSIDEDAGLLGLFSRDTVRRVGAEGERVHVATIEAEILPGVAGIIEPRFESHGPYENYVAIRHERGIGGVGVPVSSAISPTVVAAPLIRVVSNLVWRGDVDLDGTLTLTDSVRILGWLFEGAGSLPCDAAADVDADGRAQVTDAVVLLQHLFLGRAHPASGPDVVCPELP